MKWFMICMTLLADLIEVSLDSFINFLQKFNIFINILIGIPKEFKQLINILFMQSLIKKY